MINEFVRELRNKAQERDPFAAVRVFSTPSTIIDGEYIAVIETAGNIETYAFNPAKKSWIICYQV